MQTRVIAYKLKAGLASFSVFLGFAALLAFITRHFWYPHYLFWLDGGIQGLRLVYAVDIVLGPLLALVFFHPDKSRGKLLFDIVFVAAIQLSAMAWGAYQVYSQRPVAVVYGEGRFISVAPQIMALQGVAPASLQQYSDDNPPLVYRRETRNDDEKRKAVVMLMQRGFHYESQAWLFTPFHEHLDDVFQRQGAIQRYVVDELKAKWDKEMQGSYPAQYRFAFYEGRYGNALLVFTPDGQYQNYFRLSLPFIPDLADSPVNTLPSTQEAH